MGTVLTAYSSYILAVHGVCNHYDRSFDTLIEGITLVLNVFYQKTDASLAVGLFLKLTERGNDQVILPPQRFTLLPFKRVKRLVLDFCNKQQFICYQRNCFNHLQNCYEGSN